MAETLKASMKYQARDGQVITLTFETIKRYLVQGHPEYVTDQEFMYFMGVCKSRGMNPFKKDCYLIKYTKDDSAAIITSIDFLRSRAKSMQDCKGWQAGIIIKRGKDIIYSNGLMLEGDELLGGWAKGKPANWHEEQVKEVNLNGYIKYTRENKVTRFWKEESQPTQIAKVAESQLIRAIWPDEFQNLYTDAEISPDDSTKLISQNEIIPGQETKSEAPGHLVDKFDLKVKEKEKVDLDNLREYLNLVTETKEGLTIDDVKAHAMKKGFDSFWAYYTAWEGYKTAEKETEEEKHSPFVQEFWGKRKGDEKKTGLIPWMLENKVRVDQAPVEEQDILRKKFYSLYPPGTIPYPLDRPKEENKPDELPTEEERPEKYDTSPWDDEPPPITEEKPSDPRKNSIPTISCPFSDIRLHQEPMNDPQRVYATYCEEQCKTRCSTYTAFLRNVQSGGE